MPWRHQRTRRRCRRGIADSRRTRRATPCGSSRGTCATASCRQTGPSGTHSGGAGGRRPAPTRSTSSPACCPRRGLCHHAPGNGIATRAQEMHVAAALRDKGYTAYFSSRLAETGPPPPREGGPPHRGQQQIRGGARGAQLHGNCPRKAAALEIRTDGGGLTLINVHGPQAGLLPVGGTGGVLGRHTNVCHGTQPRREAPGGHRR